MSLITTLILLLLAVQPVLRDKLSDLIIARKLLEQEVHLYEDMIHLLQETEESTAENTGLSALHWQYLFWTALTALVLVTLLLWPARPEALHEPPQFITVSCSGLPQDVSEFELRLIFGEQNDSRNWKQENVIKGSQSVVL